ncbi:MAG: ArnT family glycosyltransferase [Candidatus Micrarchaeia archaeon]
MAFFSVQIAWLGIALTSALLLFFSWKNRKTIKQTVNLDKKSALLLLVVLSLTFSVQMFLPSHHRMYVDEPWYMETAKNIASKGLAVTCTLNGFEQESCQSYRKMQGWPFFLAISFTLFESSDATAFATSAVLSTLAIAIVFLITRTLFQRNDLATMASLIFAFDPTRLYWGASAETNAPAITFALLAVLAAVIVYKTGGKKQSSLLPAFLCTLILAASTRAEYVLLALPLAPLLKAPSNEETAYVLLIIAILGAATLAPQLSAFYESHSSSYPNDFKVASIWQNIETIFEKIASNPSYAALAFLALAGFAALPKKSPVFYALAGTTIAYLAVVLLWSEFSKPFQDRMLLPALAMLSIAAASALAKVKGEVFKKTKSAFASNAIVAIAVLLIALPPFPLALQNAQIHNIENEAVNSLKNTAFSNCVVVTQWPTIIHASTKLKSMTTKSALENPQKVSEVIKQTGCVLYFEDQYCANKEPANDNSRALCRKMHDAFKLKQVSKQTQADLNIIVYSVLE